MSENSFFRLKKLIPRVASFSSVGVNLVQVEFPPVTSIIITIASHI